MTRFAPLMLLAPALLAATPALAGMPAEFQTREVSYADLDLASATDQARLERRVANAARVVCVSSDPILSARCRTKARADAQMQMRYAVTRAAGAERLATSAGAPVVGN